MNLVISKCVTAVKFSNFSGHYLHNRSTLDIGVLGYIGIVQHKEHSPEVLSIPPGTPCMYVCICPMWYYFDKKFFEGVVLIRVVRDVVSWWVLTCVVMNFWVLCKRSWGGWGH